MEHQLAAEAPGDERNFAPVCARSLTSIGSSRCGLPLGIPMICGDARHRENAAPGSKVITGSKLSHNVWFVRTGILRLQRYAYDGRRQILSLYLPGDVVGYQSQLREGMSIATATQCGLCRIDRRLFATMLSKNPTLRDDFVRQQQDQLDRLHWLTWSLGALGPEERLCAFLALSTRFMPYQLLPDGTGVLSMLLPRADIADLLATTVESISRITHKMSETRIIEIRDPAHFRVLDLKKLIALGEIEGLFDRMTRGLCERRGRLSGLADQKADSTAFFCGG